MYIKSIYVYLFHHCVGDIGYSPFRVDFFIMVFSFVSSASNSVLGLTFNIFFDSDSSECQIKSSDGTVLFKAESVALALYGVRNYHNNDYCGSKLTNSGVQ